MVDKFWVVWSNSTPTLRYDSKASAMHEAQRLANKYRGRTFTVLESIGHSDSLVVNWVPHKKIQDEKVCTY